MHQNVIPSHPLTKQTEQPSQSLIDAWIETGRALVNQKRQLDWQFADWLSTGQREGYAEQVGFDFLADQLGIAPKRIKQFAATAQTFQPHTRHAELTIEHHIQVSELDKDQSAQALKLAAEKKLSPDQLANEVKRSFASPLPIINPPDDDSLLQSFIAHANRLPRHVLADALDLLNDANGTVVIL
jgi:hypothetical protein